MPPQVVVHGLKSEAGARINGEYGYVVNFDRASQRHGVMVGESMKRIKPQNLHTAAMDTVGTCLGMHDIVYTIHGCTHGVTSFLGSRVMCSVYMILCSPLSDTHGRVCPRCCSKCQPTGFGGHFTASVRDIDGGD